MWRCTHATIQLQPLCRLVFHIDICFLPSLKKKTLHVCILCVNLPWLLRRMWVACTIFLVLSSAFTASSVLSAVTVLLQVWRTAGLQVVLILTSHACPVHLRQDRHSGELSQSKQGHKCTAHPSRQYQLWISHWGTQFTMGKWIMRSNLSPVDADKSLLIDPHCDSLVLLHPLYYTTFCENTISKNILNKQRSAVPGLTPHSTSAVREVLTQWPISGERSSFLKVRKNSLGCSKQNNVGIFRLQNNCNCLNCLKMYSEFCLYLSFICDHFFIIYWVYSHTCWCHVHALFLERCLFLEDQARWVFGLPQSGSDQKLLDRPSPRNKQDWHCIWEEEWQQDHLLHRWEAKSHASAQLWFESNFGDGSSVSGSFEGSGFEKKSFICRNLEVWYFIILVREYCSFKNKYTSSGSPTGLFISLTLRSLTDCFIATTDFSLIG